MTHVSSNLLGLGNAPVLSREAVPACLHKMLLEIRIRFRAFECRQALSRSAVSRQIHLRIQHAALYCRLTMVDLTGNVK